MSKTYLLHIETAPLPMEQLIAKAPVFKAAANLKDAQKIAEDIEKKKNKYFEQAACSEATGFICAVCLKDLDTGEVMILNSLANTEEKMLSWLYDKLSPDISTITFGGSKFTYPFISRRGARYMLPFLANLFYDGRMERPGYLNDGIHMDLAAVWACEDSLSNYATDIKELCDVLDIHHVTPTQPYYKVLMESEEQANLQLNETMTTLLAVHAKLIPIYEQASS